MIWSVFGIFVLFTTCTSKMEPFILGGEFANIENYPHSVFLYMLCGGPQACGGSVLTQKTVLTAGHCLEFCSKKHSVLAYAGSENTERTDTMEPHIIGGQIATIEQFPHTVYMLLTCVSQSWICGASILTQNLVLSAAHCFKRCHQDVHVNIYVGSANIHQMPVTRYVSDYMLHRSFDVKLFKDDIALARTQKEMPLGRTIKRVLIERKFPRIIKAQLAGWGVLDDAQLEGKGQLQWLSQSIRPGGICSRFILAPGMMCVENSIESRPSHGDSGSALMANLVQQIGLVSFRHPQIIQLIFYTNVSYYYNWIQRNARQLTCLKDV